MAVLDRKSTRLNSSHGSISYAVFCLKKKNIEKVNCKGRHRHTLCLRRRRDRPEQDNVVQFSAIKRRRVQQPSMKLFFYFFFNDTATTEIYTLSLHDALPICATDIHRASARSVRRSAWCRR